MTNTAKAVWNYALFRVLKTDGTEAEIRVKGRDRWALESLIAAGPKGCTPLDHSGPRWSAYVFSLRHECGVQIETVHEKHGPPFEGNHARYVLVSRVIPASGVQS